MCFVKKIYTAADGSNDFRVKFKLPVKEIAGQIGYENEYYFIRKFKEQTGMTPGQYKKSTLVP
ncbi:MAG: helix-turn-helix transcriptional regulator [Clostridia bacterium]|nr:helix-turn-helix transcriptional regulator [Clostridia bacterium]